MKGLDPNLDGLHTALCEAFDVTSKADVARKLTVAMDGHDFERPPTAQRYSNVLGGVWSLDTLEQYTRAAGVRMVVEGGRVAYELETP